MGIVIRCRVFTAVAIYRRGAGVTRPTPTILKFINCRLSYGNALTGTTANYGQCRTAGVLGCSAVAQQCPPIVGPLFT